MKLTDGKRTVEIIIHRWNGSGFDPDWSNDYFNAGSLPYDPETDTYTVPDVGYCIDMAEGQDEEGACSMVDENGDVVPDPDMVVTVTELDNRYRITYERDGKTIAVIRKARNASDALEAICNQYGWGFRQKLISGDDCGISWATCAADTEGGINYNLSLMASIEK